MAKRCRPPKLGGCRGRCVRSTGVESCLLQAAAVRRRAGWRAPRHSLAPVPRIGGSTRSNKGSTLGQARPLRISGSPCRWLCGRAVCGVRRARARVRRRRREGARSGANLDPVEQAAATCTVRWTRGRGRLRHRRRPSAMFAASEWALVVRAPRCGARRAANASPASQPGRRSCRLSPERLERERAALRAVSQRAKEREACPTPAHPPVPVICDYGYV